MCARFFLVASMLLASPAFGQVKLQNQITFFISPDGSNSNSGMSASSPWRDLQYAYVFIQNNFDLNGQTVILNMAPGIYTKGLQATGPILGQRTPFNFVIRGNILNPAAVTIQPSGFNPSLTAAFGAQLSIEGVKFDHSFTSQDTIQVGQFSTISVAFVEFGHNFNPYNHVTVAFNATFQVTGSYQISGGGQTHLDIANQSSVYYNTNGVPGLIRVDISNSPNFFAGFFYIASNASANIQAINWQGFASGKQYVLEGNGVLDIGGTHPSEIPGNGVGEIRTGGQLLSPGIFSSPVAAQLSLSASPSVISSGESTVLTWRANYVSSNPTCWVHDLVNGYFTSAPDFTTTITDGITARGQKATEPLDESATFVLRCLDISGMPVASAPVHVVVE